MSITGINHSAPNKKPQTNTPTPAASQQTAAAASNTTAAPTTTPSNVPSANVSMNFQNMGSEPNATPSASTTHNTIPAATNGAPTQSGATYTAPPAPRTQTGRNLPVVSFNDNPAPTPREIGNVSSGVVRPPVNTTPKQLPSEGPQFGQVSLPPIKPPSKGKHSVPKQTNTRPNIDLTPSIKDIKPPVFGKPSIKPSTTDRAPILSKPPTKDTSPIIGRPTKDLPPVLGKPSTDDRSPILEQPSSKPVRTLPTRKEPLPTLKQPELTPVVKHTPEPPKTAKLLKKQMSGVLLVGDNFSETFIAQVKEREEESIRNADGKELVLTTLQAAAKIHKSQNEFEATVTALNEEYLTADERSEMESNLGHIKTRIAFYQSVFERLAKPQSYLS